MAITITPETKNSLTVANESKPTGGKWSEQTNRQWNEATKTWAVPGLHVEKETKNSLTMSNENKI